MINNILSVDKLKCYGCTACYAICPKGAISIAKDMKGFYSPIVNQEECIDCGLCLKVCPIGKEEQLKKEPNACYGVKSRDKEQLRTSTSGGAFPLVAKVYSTEMKPVICGCVFQQKRAQHLFSRDYNIFTGSKYVQSEMGRSMQKAGDYLLKGESVVFIGTPCQSAGLRSYLAQKNISMKQLLILDFICHGTPSPGMFDEYVEYIEKEDGKELKNHYFRTKYNGWQSHIEANEYEDGTVIILLFTHSCLKEFFTQVFVCMNHATSASSRHRDEYRILLLQISGEYRNPIRIFLIMTVFPSLWQIRRRDY